MAKGRIIEYTPDRGYGSILDEQTGERIIIYGNFTEKQVSDALKKGQEVEYEIEQKQHEKWAINIKIV